MYKWTTALILITLSGCTFQRALSPDEVKNLDLTGCYSSRFHTGQHYFQLELINDGSFTARFVGHLMTSESLHGAWRTRGNQLHIRPDDDKNFSIPIPTTLSIGKWTTVIVLGRSNEEVRKNNGLVHEVFRSHPCDP